MTARLLFRPRHTSNIQEWRNEPSPSEVSVHLFRLVLAATLCTVAMSCATIPKEKYAACPYDTIWEAALDAMKDRPLTTQNKEKGIIETGWLEMAASEQPFGVFGRQAFDDKDRAKMNVLLTRINDAVEVSALETRQRWHLRGGVTQQATKWWPIEPSPDAMKNVMNRINANLKDKGCAPS